MGEVCAETELRLPFLPSSGICHGVFAFVVQTFAPLVGSALSQLLSIVFFLLDGRKLRLVVHFGET